MRIAYVNCLVSKKPILGVEKRLSEQARAFGALGFPIDIFYLNLDSAPMDRRVHCYRRGTGLMQRRLATLNRYTEAARFLSKIPYDFILLRYSGADFSLLSPFFRTNAKRIVTEHHSKELPEAYTYKTILPEKVLTLFMERCVGPQMIKRCAGLIGVTDEIRRYELQRIGRSIPSRTITNGILVDEIPFTGPARYDGNVLKLLCIASSFEKWQGIDRLLLGLKNYGRDKPALHLTVVGDVSPEYVEMAKTPGKCRHVTVEFVGRLQGEQLEAVMETTHVAVSTLARFRSGMKEGCPLKTREFIARGIPFVIGYEDPDLKGDEDFVLKIPADGRPLNVEHLVDFSDRVLRQRGVSNTMREFARKRLDWKVKAESMWEFFEGLAGKRGNGAGA